jgi:hypothetical protein
MVLLIVATLAAGLFAGAAIYVNAVEHPARVSCGTELAVREFAPSYRRGAIMQASLAVVGCVAGVIGGWVRSDITSMVAGLLLGTVVGSHSSSLFRQTNDCSTQRWMHVVRRLRTC